MIIRIILNSIPIISIIYVIAGIKLFTNDKKNYKFFSLMLFACAIYSFGYFLEINSTNSIVAFAIRNFEYLGIVLIPPFGILFIFQITKNEIKAKLKALLYSASMIILLLYLSDPFSHLFYKSISFVLGKYGSSMLTVKGPGYYLLLIYYVVFLVVSSVLLLKAYKNTNKRNKKNSLIFLFYSFQLTWITVLIILLGFDKYFDPTPFTIIIICTLFVINEIKNDMFELQINKWENVYGSIKEASFLLDAEGRLVCSNLEANNLFCKINKSIKDIILDLDESEINNKPIFFPINDKIKWLDVKKNIFDTKNELTSYLLIDITNEVNTSFMAESFFNCIEDFIFIWQEDGKILFVNNEVIKKLKYTNEEIKEMYILDFHPPELQEEAKAIFAKMIKKEETHCNLPLKTKNGGIIPVETRVWLGEWNTNPVVYGLSRDISLLKETEDKFKKSFYNNPAIMALTDLKTGKYIDVNDAFINKLGYKKEELIGKSSSEIGIFLDMNQSLLAKELIQAYEKFSNIEVDIRAKNGSIFNGLFSGELIKSENTTQLITVMIDITENKKKQEEIFYLSYHDQLTGLYNRRYYEEALIRLNDEEFLPLTLIMADVNGLKLTNDAFGHKAGDLLLEKAASILKRDCRAGDIIARIGGDEFVLLLPKTDENKANLIIERINSSIVNEKLNNIILSVSIGFAVRQALSDDMDEVFSKAEDNMYRCKISESSSIRSKTIDLIMNSLFEKNPREMLHSKRVSEICEAIASNMNFSKDEINQIRIAGLMHDIGKIGIDEAILNNHQKLSHNEWNDIVRHSEIGYRILSSVNEFSNIAAFVLEHHEKWNGEGYPKGLKEEEISLQARIITIADAYDAMKSNRPYRKALSQEEAISEIKKYSGIQFDPNISKIFVENVLKKEW
jgi:diguanylate cyclase (GGDEF)-like protein/PAS domain S-box-containing protein